MSLWLRYSLIRLGIFSAIFFGLTSVGVIWWLGAIFATVISFTVSFIFFSKLRDQVSIDLAARIEKSKGFDPESTIEDDVANSDDDR
tara:strand:+ start:41 stop:301 length:261 start_codon:yes stop_codon:yes gene_type:complete